MTVLLVFSIFAFCEYTLRPMWNIEVGFIYLARLFVIFAFLLISIENIRMCYGL